MSETATNLLGKYFKKPQQATQTKTLNKLRDEHPLFFKFAIDPYFGSKIDETIDTKLDYQMNHITMPQDLFHFILKEFERLKAFENVNIQHDNQIDQLKHQISELKSKYKEEKENVSRIQLEEQQHKEALENKIKSLMDIIEQRDKVIKQHEEKINDREFTIFKLKNVFSSPRLVDNFSLGANPA